MMKTESPPLQHYNPVCILILISINQDNIFGELGLADLLTNFLSFFFQNHIKDKLSSLKCYNKELGFFLPHRSEVAILDFIIQIFI